MSEQSIMKPKKVEQKLKEAAEEKEIIEETKEIQNELDTASIPTPKTVSKIDKHPKKSL